MTSDDRAWPPSSSAGSGDHASAEGWGSAAGGLPDDVNNPWSAASGDVGLGGTASSAASANPAPVHDPYGAAAFPTYQPTADPTPPPPYGGPPTTPYSAPPTTPYPAPPPSWGYAPAAQPPSPYPPPYPPTAYPPDPYGSQGYGPSYPAAAGVNPYASQSYPGYAQQPHPRATTALVLGIVGMIPCLSLASIPAIILGRQVMTQTRQEPGRWTGSGTGTAAFVLGIIGLVLGVLWLLGAVSNGITSSG